MSTPGKKKPTPGPSALSSCQPSHVPEGFSARVGLSMEASARGDPLGAIRSGKGGALQGAAEPSGPVHLDLALVGSLSPAISADGQAIDFKTSDGRRVVHYAQLKVLDATGRRLPARTEGFHDVGVRGIRLVFQDQDAVYPVTVDPLATSPDEAFEVLTESTFGVVAARSHAHRVPQRLLECLGFMTQ